MASFSIASLVSLDERQDGLAVFSTSKPAQAIAEVLRKIDCCRTFICGIQPFKTVILQ